MAAKKNVSAASGLAALGGGVSKTGYPGVYLKGLMLGERLQWNKLLDTWTKLLRQEGETAQVADAWLNVQGWLLHMCLCNEAGEQICGSIEQARAKVVGPAADALFDQALELSGLQARGEEILAPSARVAAPPPEMPAPPKTPEANGAAANEAAADAGDRVPPGEAAVEEAAKN